MQAGDALLAESVVSPDSPEAKSNWNMNTVPLPELTPEEFADLCDRLFMTDDESPDGIEDTEPSSPEFDLTPYRSDRRADAGGCCVPARAGNVTVLDAPPRRHLQRSRRAVRHATKLCARTCPATSRARAVRWRLSAIWLAIWLIPAAFFFRQADVPSPPAPAVPTTATEPRYVTRSIEDIREDDLVLARDEFGRNLGMKRVVETYRRVSDHLRVLTFHASDGTEQTLKTTNEHPFWVEKRNAWIDAKDLQVGDTFTGPHAELHTLTSAAYEPHPEGVPVFNFQVEDYHSYFAAGENELTAILVHNAEYENLVRFGQDPESLERLAREAAAAESQRFPHGVSTRGTHTPIRGQKNAFKADVEQHFTVEQTGGRPNHFTVHLPKPVTQAVADLFNSVFRLTE